MRIVKHDITEELAIRLLGWKWISYTESMYNHDTGAIEERRVRSFLSPNCLSDKRWKIFLESHEGLDATGNEPVASAGAWCLPRITILVDE